MDLNRITYVLSINMYFYFQSNMTSFIVSVNLKSNEEDVAIITAQQVTHETHL